jgi:hypothetical protein
VIDGPFWFAVAVLGVWRVTHLLHVEDGPWSAVARVRARAQAAGPFLSGLFGCFYCLSLWTSVPFAIAGRDWGQRVLAWPALSAGAIVLELATSRLGAPPAAYFNEREEDDAVLRQDISTPAG